ncbi:MAG: DUF255 domain-containing protein [Cytophagaceae bacterium]|jgi:thioredoxin-related protein|nr:DUF255 domain-containing protein [Cytophagaceae bacterium]
MNKKRIVYLLGAGLLMCVLASFFGHSHTTTTSPSPVKWMTYEQAAAAAKKSPKPIFIDVYTHWCGWCKQMDKTTFSHPKIADYLNKKFYPVKINAESSDSTTYNGKRMTYAQLCAQVFKVNSYPSTVYLEADERLLQPLPGYMDPNQFNKVIKYIGDNHYKTTTWEDFSASFTETIE